jgi:uncharacterized protein (DUF488 family)
MTLYTIGYEGCTITALIAQLKTAGVTVLCDVRDLPLSHKHGFSKRGLAETLGRAGIGYRHLKRLGAPKLVRHRYRADHDWPAFGAAYRRHLAAQKDALRDLAETARAETVCLLCFEADPLRCHRSIVAARVRRLGAPAVTHLRSA